MENPKYLASLVLGYCIGAEEVNKYRSMARWDLPGEKNYHVQKHHLNEEVELKPDDTVILGILLRQAEDCKAMAVNLKGLEKQVSRLTIKLKRFKEERCIKTLNNSPRLYLCAVSWWGLQK